MASKHNHNGDSLRHAQAFIYRVNDVIVRTS